MYNMYKNNLSIICRLQNIENKNIKYIFCICYFLSFVKKLNVQT